MLYSTYILKSHSHNKNMVFCNSIIAILMDVLRLKLFINSKYLWIYFVIFQVKGCLIRSILYLHCLVAVIFVFFMFFFSFFFYASNFGVLQVIGVRVQPRRFSESVDLRMADDYDIKFLKFAHDFRLWPIKGGFCLSLIVCVREGSLTFFPEALLSSSCVSALWKIYSFDIA